jgi:hypothetical protein
MAKKTKMPEALRCHIKVKGEPDGRCQCETTIVNMSTWSLETLDAKAKAAGVEVDVEFLAAHAICLWHAKFFNRLKISKIRTDIYPMREVVVLLAERRREVRRRQELQAEIDRQYAKRLSTPPPTLLGAALVQARIGV